MPEYHAGYYIDRIEPDTHAKVYELLRSYLRNQDLPLEDYGVWYGYRPNCRAMLVVITVDGRRTGRETDAFVFNHPELPGMLARTLGCGVWAYNHNDLMGEECAAYAPDGTVRWRRMEWQEMDDEASTPQGPLARLARDLGVEPRVVAHDMIYRTRGAAQSLGEPLQRSLLRTYLNPRPPQLRASA